MLKRSVPAKSPGSTRIPNAPENGSAHLRFSEVDDELHLRMLRWHSDRGTGQRD